MMCEDVDCGECVNSGEFCSDCIHGLNGEDWFLPKDDGKKELS